LLSASFSACDGPPASNAQAVRQTIEAHNANAERWYLAGHVDSLVTLFAEDVWQLPPNMPPLVGQDSLRTFWTNAFSWGRWEFDLQTRDVVTSGTIAVERGRYTLKFTPAAQGPIPAIDDRGNYVVLWRQDPDGQWRAVWDAPVSELPPPGPPGR
jgi:ketosteroid isomerase-like protein